MVTKLAALALLPTVLVGGVVMNTSVLIVDVKDDDVHITVPVPLALAQVVLAFALGFAQFDAELLVL